MCVCPFQIVCFHLIYALKGFLNLLWLKNFKLKKKLKIVLYCPGRITEAERERQRRDWSSMHWFTPPNFCSGQRPDRIQEARACICFSHMDHRSHNLGLPLCLSWRSEQGSYTWTSPTTACVSVGCWCCHGGFTHECPNTISSFLFKTECHLLFKCTTVFPLIH